MSGSWQTVTAPGAPTNAGTMLLLTDGSVLCHDEPNTNGPPAISGSNRWYKLTPDGAGNYRTGTWQSLTNGPNSPLYFACSVLRDGRVFVAGGEFNGGAAQVELLAAEIYDPVANTWTTLGTPAGWTQIGDAPSCVLTDGRVLLGDINGNRCAIYDPVANSWTAGPTKDDTRCTEETWTLLPDQTVLCLECDRQPRAEKYVMAANQWVSAGSTPVVLVDTGSDEIGSALALPDGRVFCIGATANTALYTPPAIANQPGTWSAGPSFPVVVSGLVTGAKDAPACLLPNGRVLCVVAPYSPSAGTWGSPLYIYEYDPVANTLTQAPSPPNGSGNPFSSRLILLPTGQVLHTNGTSTVAIYTPDGAPDPSWKPSITSVPTALLPGHTYVLHGRQINGLSQAVIYGDEGAMATNYPIVRLVNTGTGNVVYCRTHDHSTMGIQTGTVIHTTSFTVPTSTPLGAYRLCVIANGISSDCVSVAVTHKIWKELKWEIKEHKELIKERIFDNLKLVFEDLTKINEGDWRERFGEQGWGEVIKQLVNRSDQIEGELRAFINKGLRPDVGFTPSPMPSAAPEARPPRTGKHGKVEDAETKGAGKRQSGKKDADEE